VKSQIEPAQYPTQMSIGQYFFATTSATPQVLKAAVKNRSPYSVTSKALYLMRQEQLAALLFYYLPAASACRRIAKTNPKLEFHKSSGRVMLGRFFIVIVQ
jgi:hypothetical protein